MNRDKPKVDTLLTYQMYSSIKLHFSSDTYDYFKFGLNAKTFSANSLSARNDEYKFQKLARAFESRTNGYENLQLAMASWFFYKPTAWIGEMSEPVDQTMAYVAQRERFRSAPVQTFKSNVDPVYSAIELSDSGVFTDHLICDIVVDGETVRRIPRIIDMIAKGQMAVETALIVDAKYGYINNCNRQMSNNPIWKSVERRLRKFKPFMTVTRDQVIACHEYLDRKNSELRAGQ